MTPRQEADDAVRQFAALVAQSGQETTGIPRPATVESSETSLDPSPFNIELDPTTTAEAFPGNGGGVTGLTGACCVHGVCSRISAAACATAGGTYLGDGTPCPPSSVSLSCDHISASKSKCGFGAYDGSGGYYLKQTITVDVSLTMNSPRTGSQTASATEITEYDSSTCVASVTSRSGSMSGSRDDPGSPCHYTESDSATIASGTCSGFCIIDNFYNSQFLSTWSGQNNNCSSFSGSGCGLRLIDPFLSRPCGSWDSTTPTTASYSRPGSLSTGHYNVDGLLANEYTTADLISNTEAALPAYPGTFAGSCSASRDLSDDESSYTIQRFKPKFTIPMALDDDLLICYNEHFVPDDGGDPVDTPQTVTIPGGDTEVEGDEVMEPDTDGEITITDITTCCTG